MASKVIESDWTAFPMETFQEFKDILASPTKEDTYSLSDGDALVLLGKYAFTFGINEVDAVNEDTKHPNMINMYPWPNWNDGEASLSESALAFTYEDIKDLEMLDFQEFIEHEALHSVEHPELLFQPTILLEKTKEPTIDIRELMDPQKREGAVQRMTDFMLQHDMSLDQIDNLLSEVKMGAISKAETMTKSKGEDR